jgi:predicted acetyltransferase
MMDQNIELQRVKLEEKMILQNIMEFYIYEFTRFIKGIELNEDGRYGYEGLDDYWVNPARHPFFIRVSGKLAGFALVYAEEAKKGQEAPINSITEFLVLQKYSGTGVGKVVAKQIFDLFPGKWEVTQIQKNYPAQAFWRSTISEYTNGNYKEKYDEHRRSVQEFTSY